VSNTESILPSRPLAGSTVPEFAARLRISTRTARKLLTDGTVASFMLLGRRLVDDDSIARYIEAAKSRGPCFEAPPPGSTTRKRGRPRLRKPAHPRQQAAG
jgi:hypothetical protein